MLLNAEVLYSNLLCDLYTAGLEDSNLYPGISKRQVALQSLRNSFLKKFHNEQTDSKRDASALALFLECNEQCRNFTSVQPRHTDEEYVIGELKTLLYDFFNPRFRVNQGEYTSETIGSVDYSYREPLLLNLSDISQHFGWGSGSNIGAKTTSFYTKVANSKMSYTNPSLPILYRQAIGSRSLWGLVEQRRSQRFATTMVAGSKLSFVPKNRNISRTIATEPLLNMLFQKGIAGILEGRLKEVFEIDLSKQPSRNARMAHRGSVDGRFGTIDLSSASDTISLSLCSVLIPPEPLSWFMRVRSPYTIFPNGEKCELHMVSSMGNGFTFPLMTTIFACLVAACYKVLDIKLERPSDLTDGNFAVFGDDIIVVKEAYGLVCRCLEILGFTVNREKSFNEGLFRESCGHDYYSGYNVRGVYLLRLLNDGDVYSIINRLNRWSSKHGIVLLNAIGYLRSGCRFIGVPRHEADDAGIKIPLSLLRKPRRDANGAIHYLALRNVPRRVRIPAVGPEQQLTPRYELKVGRYFADFKYCPDALLLCQLIGHLRTGSLSLRITQRKTVLRRELSPCWDSNLPGVDESLRVGVAWESFTEANLAFALVA